MAHIHLVRPTTLKLRIDGKVRQVMVCELIDEDDAEPKRGSSYRIAYRMVNGFWLIGWRHHDPRRLLDLSEHRVSRQPPTWG